MSNAFLVRKWIHFDWNFTEFCSQVSNIDYASTLVLVMVWCHTGDKQLPEPVWTMTLNELNTSPLHDWILSSINSLAPGKFQLNFRHVIFKQILVIDGWGISCEIALIWVSLDFTDDQSTLVQVMAWCRQATSHYLSQCWPSSLASLGLNE